jgi:hypothetical protein
MLYHLLSVRVPSHLNHLSSVEPNVCVYKEQITTDMPQLYTKAWVLSQARPRKMFGGQTGTATRFLRVLQFPLSVSFCHWSMRVRATDDAVVVISSIIKQKRLERYSPCHDFI